MQLVTEMKGVDRKPVVEFDLGDGSLPSLRSKLISRGVNEAIVDDVISSHSIANLKVWARALIKTGMVPTLNKEGVVTRQALSDEELQEKMDKAIPGVAKREAATPENKEKKLTSMEKMFKNMSPSEQEGFLAQLKAKLGI